MSYEVKFDELVHFTERQKTAYESVKKYKYILYGGAVGGGKSYWLRWELVYLLMDFAKKGLKGVRVGLFCEDYPALKDRHLSKIQYEFPNWLGELNKSDYEFTLSAEYGSGVICFRNLDDPSKYQSSEFAVIAVDELTKNTKEKFDFLRTRLRWANISDTKFLAGTNPGGIGHEWVKKIWIDGEFEEGEQEQSLFHFIPAKATDNPNLPSSYYLALEGLPEKMRRGYVDGNWDIFAGQYFTEWDKEKHVIEPYTLPETYKRFRAYDHGRENPACCKWYALDYDGNVIVYRELYVRGLNVDQIATQINKLSEGESYDYSIADPAIFAKTGIVDKSGGQTIAESFARYGINFYPASNRRVDGWNLMHQYLSNGKLKYFKTCKDSIRTIPSLVHDKHHPEDLDTQGEDHCFVGDTLVDTFNGKRKIRDLVGKEVLVMTSEGFKKCRSVRKTRKTEVWNVILKNGVSFKATPDHRFFTNKGWKELKYIDIRYDGLIQLDICITSYLKLFRSLMEKGIGYVARIFKDMVKDCILLCGNTIMGTYQKDFTFTTKTKTKAIMTYLTLKFIPLTNIYQYMQEHQNTLKEVNYTLKNTLDQKQFYGISQKQGEIGIAKTQEKTQKNGNGLIRFVLFVKKNIKLLNSLLIGQNTVIKIAKLQPSGIEEVYDLSVPEVENFTIHGGILVHNCADVDRYLLMSLHERKTAAPLNEVQKKMKAIIERRQGTIVNASVLNKFYYK